MKMIPDFTFLIVLFNMKIVLSDFMTMMLNNVSYSLQGLMLMSSSL